MDELAFQDQMDGNYCWGCGSLNEHGLRVRSYWSGGEAICIWQPQVYHMAGPKYILSGGIIAAIIDCHCVCTAIAASYRSEGRAINTERRIWYATASLHVTYLRPTPINEPVVLRAWVTQMTARKTILSCSLFAHEEECARGEVVAVRVPTTWGEAKR